MGSPDFFATAPVKFLRYEATSTQGDVNNAAGVSHQLEEIEYFGVVIPEPSSLALLLFGMVLAATRGIRSLRK